jgi:hypothetical protein
MDHLAAPYWLRGIGFALVYRGKVVASVQDFIPEEFPDAAVKSSTRPVEADHASIDLPAGTALV